MATASTSSIGRAVRDRLPEGKMTWKKVMRPESEKFTPDNQVGYFNRVLRLVAPVKCQLFIQEKKKFNGKHANVFVHFFTVSLSLYS